MSGTSFPKLRDKNNQSAYGIRIWKIDNPGDFYKRFGDFLKQRCKNSAAFIYFGDRKFIKNIGLKPTWKKPLSNGGFDGRFVKDGCIEF